MQQEGIDVAIQGNNSSIIQRVTRTGRLFTIVLVIFMLINMLLMYAFQYRYYQFITDINQVAALMPVVSEDIPGAVWEVITGRLPFTECKAYEMLDDVETTLDHFHSRGSEDTDLLVVRRSVKTMRTYVNHIESNINNRVSIAENQALLSDLWDVGSLTSDMLSDYLNKRVEIAGKENQRGWIFFLGCCIAEAALWAVMTHISHTANRNLAKYIETQIEQLENFAGHLADGNMNTRAPDLQTRELQPLTESLNTMAVRLESLINQSRIEQENLKKSELRTLQAQITPHFLYNTLDAIIWQAEAKNSEEVIRITRALSDFYRISLNSGAEWITVAQEKRHLEGYLAIQKVRYRDILDYDVQIDPAIEDKIILKLLLQPLVENALYHGVKQKRGVGTIRVMGKQDGDNLYFCVQDNGSGMTAERLEEIREALKNNQVQVVSEAERGSGFGLKNVNLRIRLYYPHNEGLSIESDSKGTKVSFWVPMMLKGKDNHV